MRHISYVGFGPYKIGHESQVVGPRHDPYQNDVWYAIVERDGHTIEASWKQAGLGDDDLQLVVDDKVVRREKFCFADGGFNKLERSLRYMKFELLFKRHVGITVDAAKEAFSIAWEPDPMGEPSMYE